MGERNRTSDVSPARLIRKVSGGSLHVQQRAPAAADAQRGAERKMKMAAVVLADGWTARMEHEEKLNFLRSVEGNMPRMLARSTFVASESFAALRLSAGAAQLRDLENAGGNSEFSEAMSFDVLARLFGARLVKTEMELRYVFAGSKKTDYSVSMYGHTIGVSVTRAMKFRGRFNAADAERLLSRKLYGVVASSANVIEPDSWRKQILHIWAQHDYVADELQLVYEKMPAALKADTTVLVTVAGAGRQWMFWNRDDCDHLVAASGASAEL